MIQNKKIALQQVHFSFGLHATPFFSDLSIEFVPHTINFICGKNGIGKSTILKILSGNVSIIHRAKGFLQIDNNMYDIKNLADVDSVALVAQNFNTMLVEKYSFYQNLQFALLPKYPHAGSLPLPDPLPDFIEKYGIKGNIPITQLSGGQRQILSILMVLQKRPKILLLDEPTAALDEENAKIVMTFLHDLCRQEDVTVIAIVHQLDLVESFAEEHYFELYQQNGTRQVRSVFINRSI